VNLMTKYDVAIIGGGIAGLTTAIYAAKAGKQTAIFEQQKKLGGRAITNKKQGVYFNLGGHALYKGEAYDTFQKLGLRLEGGALSSDAYGIWKNQLLTLPMGLPSLLQTPLLSWKGKMEFTKLLTKLGKMDTSMFDNISVHDWIETYLHDPMVKKLFYSLLRTSSYVARSDLMIAGSALKQLQRSLKGVWYLDKGWGSLVEELRELAVQLGVQLFTDQKVSTVEHQDQQVKSVVMEDGRKIEASNIVITTSPAIANKLVPNADQTALNRWSKQAIAVTVACLDVGLKQLTNPKYNFIYGLDLPILYSNQSRLGKPRAAKMSDDETQAIITFKYQESQSDVKQDEEQLEQVLDLIQPNWRDQMIVRQYLPKMTVVHDYPHMKRQENPEPAVPEIKGLYVAGDWVTHGELLVDASVESAKRAVRHLLQEAK
jgi:phytoene dehydrogenase-like protein